jgi:hypothetical protein
MRAFPMFAQDAVPRHQGAGLSQLAKSPKPSDLIKYLRVNVGARPPDRIGSQYGVDQDPSSPASVTAIEPRGS